MKTNLYPIQIDREKISRLRKEAGRWMRGSKLGPDGKPNNMVRPVSAQALIEFALVSLPLLMLIIGIFEFALAYFDNLNLEVTNREISRRVATNPTDDASRCGFDSNEQYVFSTMYANTGGTCGNYNPAQNTFQVWRVQYILIQRVGLNGSLNTVPTSTYKTKYTNIQNQLHDTYSYDNLLKPDGTYQGGAPGANIGYQPFYLVYVYNQSASDVITGTGFRLAKTVGDGNLNAQQKVWANPRGWTGADLNKQPRGGLGWAWDGAAPDTSTTDAVNVTPKAIPPTYSRRTCEPTDYYYVEISYQHNWATPILTAIAGDKIALVNRIKGKIEPRFFERPSALQNPCPGEGPTGSVPDTKAALITPANFLSQMGLNWVRRDDY